MVAVYRCSDTHVFRVTRTNLCGFFFRNCCNATDGHMRSLVPRMIIKSGPRLCGLDPFTYLNRDPSSMYSCPLSCRAVVHRVPKSR